MNSPRWWFLVIYCAGLFGGTMWIYAKHAPPLPPMNYTATLALEANRLLQPGDLAPAPEGGRYLRGKLAAGARLHGDGTGTLPALTVGKATLPVALAVPRTLMISGEANAGGQLRICQGKKDLVEAAVGVQAAICAESEAMCIAVLDVPVEKAAAVSAAFNSTPSASIKSTCE
jgi:hypothetical protein